MKCTTNLLQPPPYGSINNFRINGTEFIKKHPKRNILHLAPWTKPPPSVGLDPKERKNLIKIILFWWINSRLGWSHRGERVPAGTKDKQTSRAQVRRRGEKVSNFNPPSFLGNGPGNKTIKGIIITKVEGIRMLCFFVCVLFSAIYEYSEMIVLFLKSLAAALQNQSICPEALWLESTLGHLYLL